MAERRCVSRLTRASLLASGICTLILSAAEVVNRALASRALGLDRGGRTVVIVLGFANRSDVINPVNQWRVRSGIATAERYRADVVVFSGGDPAGFCESEVMAAYAQELGYRGRVEIEGESRTTEENLRNSMPFLDDADRIAIVSNPFHAYRARKLLRVLRPDRASILVRSFDVRSGRWSILIPLGTLVESAVLLKKRLGGPR
ncbi:YdcF family protein [Microbacterium sp. MPKO10]|uniref:YdcF family protein n=1 Tax=Microbacterium sp. MPKO10 TaxID=2989818 RepID=UPI00223659B7|nr:YdcF family protein [Microbacterium sp. MPKO10]MCW4458022.1 YdcF family protein [Microbacterium sp. MPKO10]